MRLALAGEIAVAYAVVLHEHVVIVERVLASQHACAAPALHVVGNRLAEQIEERRHEVDLAEVTLNGLASIEQPRHAHQERHPHGLLVWSAHLEHLVRPDHVTVLACEDDDRAVRNAAAVQRAKNRSDHIVDKLHVAPVVGPEQPPSIFGAEVDAVPHGVAEEVRTEPVEQRAAFRILEERLVYGRGGWVVKMVVRAGERRVRLDGADV